MSTSHYLYEKAASKIKALKADVRESKAEITKLRALSDGLLTVRDALILENARLREALERTVTGYAEPKSADIAIVALEGK